MVFTVWENYETDRERRSYHILNMACYVLERQQNGPLTVRLSRHSKVASTREAIANFVAPRMHACDFGADNVLQVIISARACFVRRNGIDSPSVCVIL
jgi:hypothetical protein